MFLRNTFVPRNKDTRPHAKCSDNELVVHEMFAPMVGFNAPTTGVLRALCCNWAHAMYVGALEESPTSTGQKRMECPSIHELRRLRNSP